LRPHPFVTLTSHSNLLFLCFSYARRRPSFPTRRSSDLGARPGPPAVPESLRPPLPPQPGRLPPRMDRGLPRPRQAGAAPRDRPRDRKSTRLNFSHVKISYAVFCLKKKKTNIITRSVTIN